MNHTRATAHAQLYQGGWHMASQGEGDGQHQSQVHGSGRRQVRSPSARRKRSSMHGCVGSAGSKRITACGEAASASRIKRLQADIPGGRAAVSSIESTAFAREEPCSRPDHAWPHEQRGHVMKLRYTRLNGPSVIGDLGPHAMSACSLLQTLGCVVQIECRLLQLSGDA